MFLGLVAGLIGGGTRRGSRRGPDLDRVRPVARKSKAPHEVLFVTKNLPQIEAFLRRASSVDHFDLAAGMVGRRAPQQDWYSLDAFYNGSLFPETVLERGRRPNFDRADEVLTTVRTAKNAGLDIGDEVTFAAYDSRRSTRCSRTRGSNPQARAVSVKVVGIARDPTDAQLSQTIKLLYGTPAFARKYGNEAATTLVGVWLKDGPTAARQFERELSEFTDATHGTVPVDTISSRQRCRREQPVGTRCRRRPRDLRLGRGIRGCGRDRPGPAPVSRPRRERGTGARRTRCRAAGARRSRRSSARSPRS